MAGELNHTWPTNLAACSLLASTGPCVRVTNAYWRRRRCIARADLDDPSGGCNAGSTSQTPSWTPFMTCSRSATRERMPGTCAVRMNDHGADPQWLHQKHLHDL